jgi:hypothetical protein
VLRSHPLVGPLPASGEGTHLGVLVRELLQGEPIPSHALDDLVIHICEVADVLHIQPTVTEEAHRAHASSAPSPGGALIDSHSQQPTLEHIVGKERSEVPDVCEVVYCGAAAVKGDPPRPNCRRVHTIRRG